MIKFAEYVSPGHPDKVADYISQYLLDRYIEKDPNTRYAMEVQIKGPHVTIAGEVSSSMSFGIIDITRFVHQAMDELGYTREYGEKWGRENVVTSDDLKVECWLSQQSSDIAQGLSGWGDQGIFFGYANADEKTQYMPKEHTLAKRLCRELYLSKVGGLDIKTQVIMNYGRVIKVIIAIPMKQNETHAPIYDIIARVIPNFRGEVIINGTGRYEKHGPMADCGTTGRKLAVDFYGGACRIGGGSPWTKDGSKADLTLNLYARKLALYFAKKIGDEVFVCLACCIGKKEVDFSVWDAQNNILDEGTTLLEPSELRQSMGLNKPIFASMCRFGLFGEFQKDKEWEK